MNKKHSHIDDLFRELDQASTSINKGEMWAGIENKLNQKKNRRRFVFWWSGAASVLLLVGFLIGQNYAPSANDSGAVADSTQEESLNSSKNSTDQANTEIKTKATKTNETANSRIEEKSENNLLQKDEAQNDIGNQLANKESIAGMKNPLQNKVSKISPEPYSNKEKERNQFIIDEQKLAHLPDRNIVAKKQDQKLDTKSDNISFVKEDFIHLPRKYYETANLSENKLAIKENEPIIVIDKSANSNRKWSASGGISPGFGQVELKDQFLNFETNQSTGSIDMTSLAANVQFGYQFARKWSVQSGLSYLEWKGDNSVLLSFTQTNTNNENIDYLGIGSGAGADSVAILGIDELGLVDSISSQINISAFEIPLIFRYDIISKKSNLYVTSGVSTNWFIQYQSTSISSLNSTASNTADVEEESNDVAWNNAQFNMIFSLGIEYPFLKRFALQLEPQYRYGLLSSSRSNIKAPYRGLGIRTGVSYQF